MANYTENYKLKKPEQTDFYNVDDFNKNADIIDEEMKTREEAQKKDTENIEALTNPKFDDTGAVEGITSFQDFASTVVSKMNFFNFFRNFKAGLSFITHTGMIVNNGLTTEPGFILDARYGKTLKDLFDGLNSSLMYMNHNFQQKTITNVLMVGLAYKDHIENKPCMIMTDDASTLQDTPVKSGKFIAARQTDWYSVNNVSVTLREFYPVQGRIWTNAYREGAWTGWESSVQKSDLGGMTIVKATGTDQINENSLMNTYRIMYFMDTSASYISFDVNWIRIQFKATGRDALHWRIIYGYTVGSWYQLSTT